MKLTTLCILICNVFLSLFFSNKAHGFSLKYCVPTESFDFNVSGEFKDPSRLFYLLLLTKSYISNDPSNPGILSKFHFSASGNKLTAEVSPTARWIDGRRVTAKETALGIVRGIAHRPLGKQLSVVGSDGDIANIESIRGVKYLSEYEFEMEFTSQVKNPTGILLEALSTNSRFNRMFPVRIGKKSQNSSSLENDIVSKYTILYSNKKNILFKISDYEILIESGICKNSDVFMYSAPILSDKKFDFSESKSVQALIAVFNKKRKTFAAFDRDKFYNAASFLRSAFRGGGDGTIEVESHFPVNEFGYVPGLIWESDKKNLKFKSLKIALGSPWSTDSPIRKRLKSLQKLSGTIIEEHIWNGKEDPEQYDVVMSGSIIQKGRQIWTQEILNKLLFKNFILNEKVTVKALEKVTQLSAATVPIDNETLQSVEIASLSEVSVIPIARYHVRIYSNVSLPVKIVFDSFDEFAVESRGHKK